MHVCHKCLESKQRTEKLVPGFLEDDDRPFAGESYKEINNS